MQRELLGSLYWNSQYLGLFFFPTMLFSRIIFHSFGIRKLWIFFFKNVSISLSITTKKNSKLFFFRSTNLQRTFRWPKTQEKSCSWHTIEYKCSSKGWKCLKMWTLWCYLHRKWCLRCSYPGSQTSKSD